LKRGVQSLDEGEEGQSREELGEGGTRSDEERARRRGSIERWEEEGER